MRTKRATPAPQQPYGYGNQSQSTTTYPGQYQGHQSYQSTGQPPYTGAQQPFNPGQQHQQSPGYQPYNAQQPYPGQQPYNPQGGSSYSSSSQALQQPQQPQQPQQHQWSQSGFLQQPGPIASTPGNLPYVQSPPTALTPSAAPGNPYVQQPPAAPAPHCPAPPRWIAHWSENDRQWYYVETTGRSAWQVPSDLAPLPGMPAYPGSLSMNRGHESQSLGHAGYADQARPSLQDAGKKSSSHTMLAAAGGLAAGGVADKRKAKKRHGSTPADFADFSEYPNMDVGLECNVCDQTISGPYAHCKTCDGGDWDVCRDCIAQGATCEGNGKHRLVKVYPKYYCDICDQKIQGDFYHCAWCNNGDWDTCRRCLDKGYTCRAPDRGMKHDLVALYIPMVKLGNSGKRNDGSSSSSSSSDSD
ncbi:hypothetical protein ACJZ2D_013491 [Fusarium nematophilum]